LTPEPRKAALPILVASVLAAAPAAGAPSRSRLWPDPYRREAKGPAPVIVLEVDAMFHRDIPHFTLGAGFGLVGRRKGPQPVLRLEAFLVYPAEIPPGRFEVAGGVYTAFKRNLILGMEGAWVLGVRPGDLWMGAALRPWIGAEVDFGEGLTLIAINLTIGMTGDVDQGGEGLGLDLGAGFRMAFPWPRTAISDPRRE